MSLLFSNNNWQKAEVGKGEGGIEEEGELFPFMMTDGLYLDDATHPVGDGEVAREKQKKGWRDISPLTTAAIAGEQEALVTNFISWRWQSGKACYKKKLLLWDAKKSIVCKGKS